MNLPLHELSCLHNELIWAYDHPPKALKMKVHRSRESGNWAWYLRQGQVQFRHQGQMLTVRPGQWLFLPEGETEHNFSPKAELLSIHFRCQWPTGDNLILIEAPITVNASHAPQLLQAAETLQQWLRQKFPSSKSHTHFHREQANYTNFLQLQMYFYAWLKEWIEFMTTHHAHYTYFQSEDKRILSACRILNQAPVLHGIPTGELAKSTGLSRVQLNRLFTREVGMTVAKYWDKRRLQLACDSLNGPDLSIKELAYSLGFKSDSLFVNWFRRRKGQSPGRFRLQNLID